MTDNFYQTSQQADEVAIQWLIELNSGQCNLQRKAEFKKWLASDASHQAAFRKAALLWQNLGCVDALVFSAAMLDAPKPRWFALRQQMATIGRAWRSITCYKPRRHWLSYAALSAFVIILTSYNWLTKDAEFIQHYSSAFAGNEHIVLADGSVVTLSGRSAVQVSYTDKKRQLALLYGVAHFQVQSDAARPFSVQAGDLTVTAVGTAFEVRQGALVSVAVDEGRVRLETNRELAQPEHQLAQGEKIVFAAQHGFSAVLPYDASAGLSWQLGRLDYQNTPLEDVLLDINRYRQQPVIVGHAELAQLKITASVAINNTDELLTGLKLSHQLTTREVAGQVLLLPE